MTGGLLGENSGAQAVGKNTSCQENSNCEDMGGHVLHHVLQKHAMFHVLNTHLCLV